MMNLRDIKESKQNNRMLIVLVLIFFSFSLCSFGLRQRYGFFLLGSSALLLGFKSCFKIINFTPMKKLVLILFGSLVTVYLIPSARYDVTTISFFIYVFICILTILYSTTNFKEVTVVFRLIELFSMMLALYITFFRIFPHLYFDNIYPYLSDRTAEMVLENTNVGYGAAVGQSYTFSDYIMMLGISSALGKNLQNKGKYKGKKIIVVILCFGILFEGRKGEFLSTILTILFIAILFFRPRRIKYPKEKLTFCVCALLLGLFTVPILYKEGLLFRFVLMIDRIQKKGLGMDVDFTSGRFELWNNALKLFLKFPIWGCGWGRFANYTTGSFVGDVSNQAIKDVHNCFLQLLCETGIIGTFIILVPLFRIYKKTICQSMRIRHNMEQNHQIIQMNIFSLCMQTYFLIVFFLDPVFYNPFYWCSFAIVVIIEDFALKEERRALITNQG